jgi:hypothetical protein
VIDPQSARYGLAPPVPPTPHTPVALASLPCVRMGRHGRVLSITIRSTADVRALAQWCSMPMTHAGTRRTVLAAVCDWIERRECDLAMREREQADRERGCVALLLDAAQRIGEVERA